MPTVAGAVSSTSIRPPAGIRSRSPASGVPPSTAVPSIPATVNEAPPTAQSWVSESVFTRRTRSRVPAGTSRRAGPSAVPIAVTGPVPGRAQEWPSSTASAPAGPPGGSTTSAP